MYINMKQVNIITYALNNWRQVHVAIYSKQFEHVDQYKFYRSFK